MKKIFIHAVILLNFVSAYSQQLTNFVVDNMVEGLMEKESKLASLKESARTPVNAVETKEARKNILEARFDIANQVVTTIIDGMTITDFIQDMNLFISSTHLQLNLWNDTLFRNLFDKISDFGTVAGTALIAVSALNQGESEDKRIMMSGYGAGFIALVKVIGELGGTKTKKVQQKLTWILATRRAYDDLQSINTALKLTQKNDSDFVGRVKIYQTQLKEVKTDTIDSKRLSIEIAELMGIVSDYRIILNNLPNYLFKIQGLATTYESHYQNLPDQDKANFIHIKNEAQRLSDKYKNNVRPLLDVSSTLYAALIGVVQP